MKVTDLLETFIDNENGAGATPNNQEVDYFGLRVLMEPTVFLGLVTPLSRKQATSTDGLKQHISSGGKIGAPTLYVKIPPEWEDGDLSSPAEVTGHEGRNRMFAIKELYGDRPVEVHIIPGGGLRARHLKPEWVQALSDRLIAERSSRVVAGPLFTK